MGCLPSSRSTLRHLTYLCLAGLCLLAGCSPRKVSLRGKAMVDGKPLTIGVIKLVPDKGNELKNIPSGTIDGEGNYEIFFAEREGAPLGRYKVCVRFDKKEMNGTPPPVHMKYTDPTQTPISIEIVANPQPGAYDVNFSEK
jgi:hypothetical protein